LKPELFNLLQEIKALPYGRNSDRSDYSLILKEQKGTCSTKHAYVKHIALKNSWDEVKLFIGIYMMKEKNTPGVGTVLKKYDLTEIPEAHTYLKIEEQVIDITGLSLTVESFEKSLQQETEITPEQIGDYKLELLNLWHKSCVFCPLKTNNLL